MPADSPSPDSVDARLRRVEESQAYADRSSESLTQQLLAIDRSLRALSSRLERLERRVGDVMDRLETDAGGPPHPANEPDVPDRDD